MSLLNNRFWTLRLRRGTQANLMLATTLLQEGEPAYTTDTKQTFIADASNNKIPICGAVYAVLSLPAGTSGARAFVNNALAPTFGAAPVTGGAVFVPVFWDGNASAWKVG